LLAGLIAAFFFLGVRLRRFVVVAIFAGICVLALPQTRARLSGNDEGAAEDRWHLARIAEGMILANPVAGVGINNYRLAMYKFVPSDYDWNFIYRVHTLPLLVLAETGVIGFAGFCLMFWRAAALGAWRDRQFGSATLARATLAGLTGAVVATALHGLFDVVWSAPPVNAQFFAILGIGALAIEAHSRASLSNSQEINAIV
jgi:hypothetical protein